MTFFATTKRAILFMSALLTLTPNLTVLAGESTQTNNNVDESIERLTIHYRQAYRGNVSSEQLPQAISVLDQQLINDAGLTRFQDVLDYSASVARQNNGGGLWDSFSLRGFPGNENMPSGYLINGFNGGRGFSGHRDLSNVAYVEILKGPGSALYGRSEPGGTVNIVTKKPQYQTSGYLKATGGNFDQYRLEGDFTSGLTNALAFRINGAWQEYDSFRDHVFSDKKIVTPSVRWQLSDKASLLYEVEYLKQEQLFDRGFIVLDNNINTLPRSRYLGEPNDGPTVVKAMGHQLTYDYQLNDQWSFVAGYNYRDSSLKGFSSDAELAKGRQSLFDDGRTLTRQHRYRDYSSADNSVRLELSGMVDTGVINHNLLLGADAYHYKLKTGLYRYRGKKGEYAIDIFDPQYGGPQPDVSLLYEDKETQKAWGAYIQDQMDLTEQWKLHLGLRFDHYEQDISELVKDTLSEKTDSRVSPKIGLVYQWSNDLSFYASYSEGFLPLSGTDYAGMPFDPEESLSTEIGMKFNGHWLNQLPINGSIAIFDAKKSNILTSDPVNVGFSATLGEAKSTGVELDLAADISDYLQAQVSYAYLNTRTANDTLNVDWGVLIPAGSPLVNVPEQTASLVLKQDLNEFDIDGHIGLSWRYVDSRLGDSAMPSFELPFYQLVGLFANTYLNDNLSLGVNIDNLLDEVYIANSYSALWAVPGEPRNFKVSVKYEF
ncbi:TonB-dependent siderophore receptor [Shewanella psychrotolerans]|uniref:TonB-dependent siderophore receptor n=1 Tax=Shewanella psychrotolerans TaxID=2864206 RepID=UPI001C659158|nr:TonB-dependent siderophore receptor [Shewanella psychrotolerans]QYK01260.1 TonB-dependent siderophore receptor [Shewanella psychrotolerans]